MYEIHRKNGDYIEKAALKMFRIPQDEFELEQLLMEGLRPENAESYFAKQVEEIRNEIGVMQRFVGNSNIVSYEDYRIDIHEGGIGWDILIRMELLTPLPDYIKSHSMSEKDVIRLGTDISKALTLCHKAGIIHRDIKPQNIFVNQWGAFKLGDFGIAKVTSKNESVMSFKGTIAYMAPETFQLLDTDARSDIYSLALVLYHILNGGKDPFLSTNSYSPQEKEAAQRRRLSGERVPPPEHGNEKLWRALSVALQGDPSFRYQTAAQFHDALVEAGANNSDLIGGDEITVAGFWGHKSLNYIDKEKQPQSAYSEETILHSFSEYKEFVGSNSDKESNTVNKTDTYAGFSVNGHSNARKPSIKSKLKTIILFTFSFAILVSLILFNFASISSSEYPPKIYAMNYPKIIFFVLGLILVIFIMPFSKQIQRVINRNTLSNSENISYSNHGDQECFFKFDVFISYKHTKNHFETKDCRIAEELYDKLTSIGLNVFLDKESLYSSGATNFRKEIENALNCSRVLLVVTTLRDNLYSEWIDWEIKTFSKGPSSDNIFCYTPNYDVKSNLPEILNNCTCLMYKQEVIEYIANKLGKDIPSPTKEDIRKKNIDRVWNEIHLLHPLSNGRYDLHKIIKKGEYYVLVAGYDNNLENDCVIKIINRNTVPDSYVDSEISILKKHWDSGIPFLYDNSENSPDISYSVMTYVPGRSFEEIKKSGQTIIEKDVIGWIIRLLEILSKLHNDDESIIHCNIQPNNIFLGDNQQISLINFSCAYSLNGTKKYKYVARNKRYAAPEIIASGKPIDGRTDIFSVGFVMLYMLTDNKKTKFKGKIVPTELGISQQLSSVICKCMATNPDERYFDCTTLINDLRSIQEGRDIMPQKTFEEVDLSFASNMEITESNNVTVVSAFR